MLEIMGAVSGLVGVVLMARRNAWGWPVGGISCVCYGWVFLHGKLYGNAGLQLVYLALSVHGWWHWRRDPATAGVVAVRRLRGHHLGWLMLLAGVGTLGTGAVLARTGGAAQPYGDALVTVTSLIAQGLLARGVVENWALWVVADVVMVVVAARQRLVLTAGFYAVLAVVAAVGYRAWLRAARMPASS